MFTEEEWAQFCRTGRVTDYLRYRGAAVAAVEGEKAEHATENGCADHPGKQSYR